MYSKLKSFSFFLPGVLLLGTAGAADAQAPTSAPTPAAAQAPAAATTIRGKVADPTGALIPGATITISNGKGQTVATATADAGGSYEVHTSAPGTFTVTATYSGFAPFVSQGIVIGGGQIKRIDITMAIETTQQTVTVTDESPTVNVDPDNNGSAMVIKGKDLDALSDDPDELSDELSALAGPSAGPNGGQIYIDGFTGGQLPPKSSIREIRVNQNPYSAEYDKLGFGRIEILTKPGTDHLHGQFMAMGNDSSFNTNSPFTKNLPSYDSYQYSGNVNGSLNKSTSFFVSAEHRAINDLTVFDAPCDAAGDCSSTDDPDAYNGSIANPHSRTNLSARIDRQIGAKNTLTARYQYYHDSEDGNLTSTQLPTLAYSTETDDNQIQLSDTEVISDKVVNETRFQYDRATSSQTPVSTAPTIQVQEGSFSTGGSSAQSERDRTDRWELQNLTTMSLGKHAVKFGMRLRDTRDSNSSDAGFNGAFTFALNQDYSTAVQAAIAGQTSTATPTQLTYSTGTQAAIANVFDGAAFIQDDWRYSPRLTLSAGLRIESQNHVSDHFDVAPRFSMAYALDGKKGKQAKTVARAGYGIFYDRMQIADLFNSTRSFLQDQITLNDTDGGVSSNCFTQSFVTFDQSACGSGVAAARSIYQVAPSYRSPYSQQFGASLERQLTKTQTVTITYLHTLGVHQLVEINANAPYFPDYTASNGNQYQYFPEGVYKQNQLIINSNARVSKNLSFFGFYTLSFANTNGSGGSTASDSLNLSQDQGRSTFTSRNFGILVGNYMGPWGIRFNPFMLAQSGKPFDITDSTDNNGDTFFNDRPYVASSSLCTNGAAGANGYYQTAYGCLDTNNYYNTTTKTFAPPAGETLIKKNSGNGPTEVAFNLRVSRTFGIGPKLKQVDPQQGGGGPGGGGPPGGGGGGGRGGGGGGGNPGGGFGGGGFGGGGGGRGGPGGMFAPTQIPRKYNLTFSAQAQNIFNNINYGTPTGVVGSSAFGESRSLQGGPFSSGTAPRLIRFQAQFAF